MKIGFIGIGNMGGAILSGYAASEAASDKELLVYSTNEVRNQKMQAEVGGLVFCESEAQLCAASDIIVLGVKPQVIEGVLEKIAAVYTADKIVVSMAAGVSIAVLERHLGTDAKIVRIMPNTPAKVREAMTSISRNGNLTDAEFLETAKIFKAIGMAEEVSEDQIDCVIGVSGSSPAYTYLYIEALMQAAVANGMTEEKARIFAAQSVLGAAKMVLESEESVEQLRINVCSPNGTTIEAVHTLLENGFVDKVKEGFQAAVDRSIEMTAEKAGTQK